MECKYCQSPCYPGKWNILKDWVTLLFTCYAKLLNSWAAFDNYIWVNGIILGSLVYWIWHFYKCWSSGTHTDMSNKLSYHLVDSVGIAIAPEVRLAVWCQLSGPECFCWVLTYNDFPIMKFYVLNYEKWKKVHFWDHLKHERAMFARDTLNCGNLLMGWFQWSIRSLLPPYWQHLIFPAFLKSDIGFGWMYQNYWTDSNVSSVSGSTWLLYSWFWRRWAEPRWAHGS